MAGRRVAITGASGLIGSALTARLEANGWEVYPMVRRKPEGREIRWDPVEGKVETVAMEGLHGVIHLAGESINQRWTPDAQDRIRTSRVRGTLVLTEALARLEHPPSVLVSASAIGYYGDGGEDTCTEKAVQGGGFLASVCAAWERAADPARKAGIRVVHPRFGIVLSRDGGALKQMLPPARMGLAGPVGSGRQWMSWIALDDLTALLEHMLTRESMEGRVNAVAPNPVRNRDFMKALGKELHRPAFMPLPAFAVKAMFGEMGKELLLWGQRVDASRAGRHGFKFQYPELPDAMRQVLHPMG